MNIVSTNVSYNSSVLYKNINDLLKMYPFLKLENIGYSVLGKPIYVITIGNGKREVFYSAAIHANEWITSPILMKFIEDISNAYVKHSKLFGYYVNDILNETTIHFCPMINPDGVDLVTGLLSIGSPSYVSAKKIASNYSSIPFPDGWKANIRGVDLNLQFPARLAEC
jgi:g-D-glutamyl-meso-diaminopimelate peptidase